MRVGFVGLGNMGSVMARKLVKAGRTLTVYDQTPSRAEALPLVLAAAQGLGEADWATIAPISFREAGL
jgi:3-hydroxyisobutyrate dehydrogenase